MLVLGGDGLRRGQKTDNCYEAEIDQRSHGHEPVGGGRSSTLHAEMDATFRIDTDRVKDRTIFPFVIS